MKWIVKLFLCAGLMLVGGCAKEIDLEHLSPVTIENSVEVNGYATNFSMYKWVREPYAEVIQIPQSEVIRLIKEGGSGIIYFGRTSCEWCQRAVPELNEVAAKMNVTVYYVDSTGPISDEDFAEITDCLSEILEKDKDGNPKFYAPFVVGVKDGTFTGWHDQLVKGFEIKDNYSQMNDEQKEELQQYYAEIIKKTAE